MLLTFIAPTTKFRYMNIRTKMACTAEQMDNMMRIIARVVLMFPAVFILANIIGLVINLPCGEFNVPCELSKYSIRNHRDNFNRSLNNTEVYLPFPICSTTSIEEFTTNFSCVSLKDRTKVEKYRVHYNLQQDSPTICKCVDNTTLLECESIVLFDPQFIPEEFQLSDLVLVPCTPNYIGRCYVPLNYNKTNVIEFYDMWSSFISTANIVLISNTTHQSVDHKITINDPLEYKNRLINEQVYQLKCYSGYDIFGFCVTNNQLHVGTPDGYRTHDMVVNRILTVYGAILFLLVMVLLAMPH